jgi:hypothetical protein
MAEPMCMLLYDIPTNAPVPNPSGRLRRIAVRVNLSCWVVPESRVPYHLLHDMAQGGASWHVVRFDTGEAGNLARMALDALRKEADAAVRRALRSEGRAADRAAEPEADPDAYLNLVRRAVRRAEGLLADLAAGAASLGLGGLDTGNGLASLANLRSAAEARALLYAGMREEAEKAGDARAAELAARDEVPGVVLADMLEERGVDVTAARNVFADVSFN